MITPSPIIAFHEGIHRFGDSSSLYFRCLKRFPADPSFFALEESLNRSDAGSAYLHAHTLKGLCAQLGLAALFPGVCKVCNLLRSGQNDGISEASALYASLKPVYDETVSLIHDLP